MQDQKTSTVSNETPLAIMTLGQLKEALQQKEQPQVFQQAADKIGNQTKHFVYGLAGIRSLFNCSHLTAQRYKDGLIKDAVYQHGRKIVVDADKALELFNAAKESDI